MYACPLQFLLLVSSRNDDWRRLNIGVRASLYIVRWASNMIDSVTFGQCLNHSTNDIPSLPLCLNVDVEVRPFFFHYKSDKFNLNSSGLTCFMLHVRVWIYWTLLANGTRARQWMRLRIESRVRDAMFFRLSNHTIWTCPTIWNDDLWYADCVYVCVCMCLSLLIASVWLDGFSFCSSHRE